MFLTGRGTLASCPHQKESRDKRVTVAVTGSRPLAGKLAPEYPEWSGCQSQRRRVPARVAICYRKADPFQGLKLGSCLTLRSELSEETHVLTKQEILLGKGTPVESSRVRKPRYFNQWKPTYSANAAGALNIKSVLMLPSGISRWCLLSHWHLSVWEQVQNGRSSS